VQHCLQQFQFQFPQVVIDYRQFEGSLDRTVNLFPQPGSKTKKKVAEGQQIVFQELSMQLRKLWRMNQKLPSTSVFVWKRVAQYIVLELLAGDPAQRFQFS
jgi:hypothetical protein